MNRLNLALLCLSCLTPHSVVVLTAAQARRVVGLNPGVALWRLLAVLLVGPCLATGLVSSVVTHGTLGSTTLVALVVAALLVSLVTDSRHKPPR